MFIYLDTETTGTDEDDRLCQIAFKTETGLIVNELFNPGNTSFDKTVFCKIVSMYLYFVDILVSGKISVLGITVII